ncbi:MAG: lasso peptide biosynthesis B2 protein [Nitrospira sp.]|nr:lasso peptide biosynthesis B2 protein [Nitrospira sp.]
MSSVRKYRLIVATGVVVVGVRIVSRLTSLRRLLGWLSCEISAGPDEHAMENVAYYVDRWLALFPYNPKGNCFPRALALFFFARRAGLPVQFKCGVMKLNQQLEGHAWLVLHGHEFLEPSSHWQSFTVTVTFPQSLLSSSTQSSRIS